MRGKPGNFHAVHINVADLITTGAAVGLTFEAQPVFEKFVGHSSMR
jgi:hypothetical protein